MQGSTLVMWWMVLLWAAFIAANIMGLCYPFVSKETKEKLKDLEIESGYKCKVIYRDSPTVEIEERYSIKAVCMVIAMIMLAAWIVFVFVIGVFGMTSPYEPIFIALVMHGLVWFMLSTIVLGLSFIKVRIMKKSYEWRQANVKISKKMSLSYFFDSL